MNLTPIPRTALLAFSLLSTTTLSGMAADVTSDRLMNADKEPQNWLMVNKDYASHRYSELDQINKSNVKNLHVAFTVAQQQAVVGRVRLADHQHMRVGITHEVIEIGASGLQQFVH